MATCKHYDEVTGFCDLQEPQNGIRRRSWCAHETLAQQAWCNDYDEAQDDVRAAIAAKGRKDERGEALR